VAPAGDSTRPTSDRVREAVFNALWSRAAIEDARVLDLFAGSGAMGIEALSRGASHATFVDTDAQARRAIAANLASCGMQDRAEVLAGPAERVLRDLGAGSRFGVAFCDPPSAYAAWSELLPRIPADLVVIEAGARVTLPSGWELARESTYGPAWVGFASPPATPAAT
jgi:16S rRNA (guanine966-N2)-methyltransferase